MGFWVLGVGAFCGGGGWEVWGFVFFFFPKWGGGVVCGIWTQEEELKRQRSRQLARFQRVDANTQS